MRRAILSLVVAAGLGLLAEPRNAAAQVYVPNQGGYVPPGYTTGNAWGGYSAVNPWQNYYPGTSWTGYVPPAATVPPQPAAVVVTTSRSPGRRDGNTDRPILLPGVCDQPLRPGTGDSGTGDPPGDGSGFLP